MTDELEIAVIDAALRVDTPEKWRAVRAAAAAISGRLNAVQLSELAQRLKRPPEVPPGFRAEQGQAHQRRVAWRMLWTETVCEVFHQSEARGVPALREQAFSGDDPGSSIAFSLLCRLAARGVERERFIEDFERAFLQAHPDYRVLMVDGLERHGIRVEDGPVGRETFRHPAFQVEVERLRSLPGYGEAKAALLDFGPDE
jgi:hypothetical protein